VREVLVGAPPIANSKGLPARVIIGGDLAGRLSFWQEAPAGDGRHPAGDAAVDLGKASAQAA